MTTRSPSNAEVLDRVLRRLRGELRTCFPATVVSYDRGTQTAKLRPGIKAAVPTFDDPDVDEVEALPDLPEVPVCWPGGGQSFLACDLVAGDGVIVVCADTNWDAWWRTGTAGAPEDGRSHDLSYAFAIPCLRRPALKIQGLTGPLLQLSTTSIPGDALALASVLDTLITTILGWTPSGGDGGAALKAAVVAAFPGFTTSGSARTKVDS